MSKKLYLIIGLAVCLSLLGFTRPKKRKPINNIYEFEYPLNYSLPKDSSYYTISYQTSTHPQLLIHIVDSKSKEDLVGVNFMFYEDNNAERSGSVSDVDGKIEIELNNKINELIFNYLGYTSLIIDTSVIDYKKDNNINVFLGQANIGQNYILRCKHKHSESELRSFIDDYNTIATDKGFFLLKQKLDTCDCSISIVL